MKISRLEQDAIRRAVEAGRDFGYGNMISHLQSAWVKHLIDGGMDPETAARHGAGGYPVQMHLDLLERGEWDETGQRYKFPT
jgi:hypothetical protein